jgi:hypothetical protein
MRRRFRGRVTAALIVVLPLAAVALHGMAAPQSREARTLDATKPITYFIADGDERTGFRRSDRQLAEWALEAWQRHAGGSLRLEAAPESNALVRLYWAGPNDGQYGEMRPLMVGGRRGAAVFIRPDMESLGPDIAARTRLDGLLRDGIVYLTCLHELGHAFGLAHTAEFRDIMYFFGFGGDIGEYFGRYRRQLKSRNDIVNVSGLSAADIAMLTALYARQ